MGYVTVHALRVSLWLSGAPVTVSRDAPAEHMSCSVQGPSESTCEGKTPGSTVHE